MFYKFPFVLLTIISEIANYMSTEDMKLISTQPPTKDMKIFPKKLEQSYFNFTLYWTGLEEITTLK